MKHVKKSVLLWYSPHEMYSLVTAIADYPDFLPWCDRADVLQQHADGVTARLGLAYMGLRHAFTTRNVQVSDSSVAVSLVDGPFSLLDGTWLFTPLGRPGNGPRGPHGPHGPQGPQGPQGPPACKIEFDLRYSFASPALEVVVSPVFDTVANTFVDSFVRRAEAVYGVR